MFDHVIVGAGFSGVMLAWRLLQDSPVRDTAAGRPRILMVERFLRAAAKLSLGRDLLALQRRWLAALTTQYPGEEQRP